MKTSLQFPTTDIWNNKRPMEDLTIIKGYGRVTVMTFMYRYNDDSSVSLFLRSEQGTPFFTTKHIGTFSNYGLLYSRASEIVASERRKAV